MATSEEPEPQTNIVKYADTFHIPGEYYYDDDLLLGCNTKREVVEDIRSMQFDKTDVLIISYPKTGTTLLQEVVWLLRHKANEEKAKIPNYKRVPFLEESHISRFYELEKPRTAKLHLPYRLIPQDALERKCRIVYIYRNPRDTLVSYYHFHQSLKELGSFSGTFDDFFDLFYRVGKGILYQGSMLNHFRDFWQHRDDENILITSYETLVKNPNEEYERIADFLTVDYDNELIDKIIQATKFESMKSNPATNYEAVIAEFANSNAVPFMRKGKIGDWKNYFSQDQITKLDEMVDDVLGGTGMTFVYE